MNLVSKAKISITELKEINNISTETNDTIEQLSKNNLSNQLNSLLNNFADGSSSSMKEVIKCEIHMINT